MSSLIFNKNYPWHLSLKKSPLNPPGWLFTTVMLVLYSLFALSCYTYLQVTGYVFTKGLLFFGMMIMTNFLWMPIFFIMKSFTVALLDLVVV